MNLYKILPSVFLTLIVMTGAQGAHAQTSSTAVFTNPSPVGSPTDVASHGPICFTFPVNIWYGATDSATQNGVTNLQTFLSQQGYFSASSIGTGRFGPITLSAVQRFQAANALPTTGYVGPLTRATIVHRCGNPTPTPTPSPTGPVSINSISPNQAPVGATVTIYGNDFTGSNTILMDGSIAQQNVPAIYPPSPMPICPPGAFCPAVTSNSSTGGILVCPPGAMCANPGNGPTTEMLSFKIPSSLSPNCPAGSMCPMYMRLVTPGQYTITVQNSKGTSNTQTLTVGPSVANSGSLTITGLDAPSSLAVGQTGTWTVHAVTNSGSGNLHYSVNWGDSSNNPSALAQPEAASVANSSSFTHSYAQSGTYTATFTVSDDFGNSVSSSNTLTVTPLYY